MQPGMLMISKASEKQGGHVPVPAVAGVAADAGQVVRHRRRHAGARGRLENPKLTEGPRKQFYEAVQETMAHGSPWDKGPKLYEAFDAVNRMQQAVGQGKATPEDALARCRATSRRSAATAVT